MTWLPATREDLDRIYREADDAGTTPVVSSLSFIGQDLSGFDFEGRTADEHGHVAQLSQVDFRNANLDYCNLSHTDLAGANLRGATLRGAVLRGANLFSARLRDADLSGADLSSANLVAAELIAVILDRANLADAVLGQTTVATTDLANVAGLPSALHSYPSAIAADTMRLTASSLATAGDAAQTDVFAFFANAGVHTDLLGVVKTWFGKPVRYHSVFLSHSSLDKEFARRLYEDLRSIGVDCWFDEKRLVPGDWILDEIDRGIRMWDKVLLVCSRNSLDATTGWWVEQEIQRALDKERNARRSGKAEDKVLVPITIDDFVYRWTGSLQPTLVQRSIGDFTEWRSPARYEEALNRLARALNPDRTMRPCT